MLGENEKNLLTKLRDGKVKPTDYLNLEFLKEKGYVCKKYELTEKGRKVINIK
jgi:hypothetical protein